jgi:hypothetical protein
VGEEPLADRIATGARADVDERKAAQALALLVADQDTAAGDLVHALDAAATLAGVARRTRLRRRARCDLCAFRV